MLEESREVHRDGEWRQPYIFRRTRKAAAFRHALEKAGDPADEVVSRTNRKPTSTDLPRTASSALASLDHPHWSRRWLERVGLALAERGSLRPCARVVGDGSGASAPVLSNSPRWWQLVQECPHSVARPKRFRDPPHRETWSRLAAICDTSRTGMRKASCPAPASQPGLRNIVPMNQVLVGCSDLPSPMFFL